MKCPNCAHEWNFVSDRWMPKFPVSVSCCGRRYVAQSQGDLEFLIALLVDGRMALANRYRVGGRWGTEDDLQARLDGAQEPAQRQGQGGQAWQGKEVDEAT
jgi:hypothetical protein